MIYLKPCSKFSHLSELLAINRAQYIGFILTLVLTGLFFETKGQQQVSKADRYVDAHLKYQEAICPIEQSSIKHFVYFSKDREKIKDHPFLHNSSFTGAQIMYSWDELEP